jgi:hypothetical protein
LKSATNARHVVQKSECIKKIRLAGSVRADSKNPALDLNVRVLKVLPIF